MSDLLSFIIGYIVGSVPFAYLIVKKKAQVDIRQAGSGNVGSFNAFQVSGSKSTGVIVGLLDGGKGAVAVFITGMVFGSSFWVLSLALVGAVIGHNFPVWLKFKGGRGLATACGGLFLIGVSYTIIWCLVWAAAKFRYKDIIIANILATILGPMILLVIPELLIESLMIADINRGDFLILIGMLTVPLLISHRDGFKSFVGE